MAEVDQALSTKPLQKEKLAETLSREVVPVIRSLRVAVNDRLRCSATSVGDGVAVAYDVLHSWGPDVLVQVYDAATGIDSTDVSSIARLSDRVTVTFTGAPAANARRVLVRP